MRSLEISDDALRLHRESIVFDAHYDRVYQTVEMAQDDLPALTAGGVTAHIRQTGPEDVFQFIERAYEAVETWPDRFVIATRAEHIRQAKREGKIASLFSIEGAEALRGDLTTLRALYRLGLRNVGLTWSTRNAAADGVDEIRTGGGLTRFGVALVKEMRRLGIMLDISHLAPAGVRDVFDIYDGPVVATHANCQAVCRHRRNLTDPQLEQVAASGGIVGVTFVPRFITDDGRRATLDGLLDHVDHIVQVAGIDHVGLGSDWGAPFDKRPDMPTDYFMKDISDLPVITQGLLHRGYADADIRKVLGANWLRVFEEVAG